MSYTVQLRQVNSDRCVQETNKSDIHHSPAKPGQVKALSLLSSGNTEWEITVRVESSRKNYAKPCEWAIQRERITDLYRVHPLHMVVDIMGREHDFWASEKMYKDRLKEWRLNTKNKKPLFRARRQRQTPEQKTFRKIAAASFSTQSRKAVPWVTRNFYLPHQYLLSEHHTILKLPDFDHSQVILTAVQNWIKSSIGVGKASGHPAGHPPVYLYTCACCALLVHKHMSGEYHDEKTSTLWTGRWSDKRYIQLVLREAGGLFTAPVLPVSLAWLLSILMLYVTSFGLYKDYKPHQLLSQSQFNIQSTHPLIVIVTGLGAPSTLSVPLAAKTIECMQGMIANLKLPYLRPYTEISMKLDQIILILKFLFGGLASNDFLQSWKSTVDKGLNSLPLIDKTALDIRLVYIRLLKCFKSTLFVQEVRKCLALTAAVRWRTCAEYRALFFIEIAEVYYCHNEVTGAIEYMKEAASILDWIEDVWLEQKRDGVLSVLNNWIRSSKGVG